MSSSVSQQMAAALSLSECIVSLDEDGLCDLARAPRLYSDERGWAGVDYRGLCCVRESRMGICKRSGFHYFGLGIIVLRFNVIY